MYGAFSGLSFGLVILGVLFVIALAVAASPLLAVIVASVIAVGFLIGMTASRRRSAQEDEAEGGAADTHATGPAGRRATHRRASGEPASGEGRS
jgi:hypothetical protein